MTEFAGEGAADALRFPEEVRYHAEHAWARIEGEEAVFGITWFAQDALGSLVYVELPQVAATVSADAPYASVESAKTISDVFAPLSGEVVAVNLELEETPTIVNTDPYEAGWIARVRLSDPAEAGELLDAAAYLALTS